MRVKMNFVESLTEIGFLGTHSIVFCFAWDNAKQILSLEEKETLGWVMIGLISMVLIIEIMLLIEE